VSLELQTILLSGFRTMVAATVDGINFANKKLLAPECQSHMFIKARRLHQSPLVPPKFNVEAKLRYRNLQNFFRVKAPPNFHFACLLHQP